MTHNGNIEKLGLYSQQSSDSESVPLNHPIQVCSRCLGTRFHYTLPRVSGADDQSLHDYSQVDLLRSESPASSGEEIGNAPAGHQIRAQDLPGGIAEMDRLIANFTRAGIHWTFRTEWYDSIYVTGPYNLRFIRNLVRSYRSFVPETDSEGETTACEGQDSEWSLRTGNSQ